MTANWIGLIDTQEARKAPFWVWRHFQRRLGLESALTGSLVGAAEKFTSRSLNSFTHIKTLAKGRLTRKTGNMSRNKKLNAE